MQETKELQLPVTGKTVLIRGYVTGLIDNEVRRIRAAANKMSIKVDPSAIDSNNPQMPEGDMVMETDPTAIIDADNKLLQLMVLAIDGNTGDVFNQLMALPAQDVNFVASKVKALYEADEVAASDPKAPAPAQA